MPAGRDPTRTDRAAGTLAILLGVVGVFAGLSGAFTFILYRAQDNLSLPVAEALTGISALAAALSGLGIAAGWRLLRGSVQARSLCLGVAAGCVAAVGAFAAAMPASSPSPVPGGAGPPALVVAAAMAYGVEAALLLLRGATRAVARAKRTAA